MKKNIYIYIYLFVVHLIRAEPITKPSDETIRMIKIAAIAGGLGLAVGAVAGAVAGAVGKTKWDESFDLVGKKAKKDECSKTNDIKDRVK